MLNWLKTRNDTALAAGRIYGAVVAQARTPAFYSEAGAKDTPEGRFELLILHLFLAAERIRLQGPDGQDLSRTLIEAFVTDMDDCMREMGVGDLTIPKRVKSAAATFYDRTGRYRKSLSAKEDEPLVDLIRELFPGVDDAGKAPTLSRYIREQSDGLSRQGWPAISSGDMTFIPFS